MSSSSPFYINTKGSCLLCLQTRSSSSHDASSNDDAAFKMFLRYLKVDQRKLAHFSSSALSSSSSRCSLDSLNFSVTLCDDCSSVANDFLELFQAYEGIRIQLDLCVKQLHEFMEKGDKDRNRISEYERKMNARNVEDLLAASIAESLRKETMEKVSRKLKCSVPRISLQELSTSTKTIEETQTKESAGKSGGAHFWPPENTDSKDKFNDEMESVEVNKENERTFCKGDGDRSMVLDNSSIGVEVEDTPKISEQIDNSKRYKCDFCAKRFTRNNNAKKHKLLEHTMAALSGRLPQSVSLQSLNAALQRIYTRPKIIPSLSKTPYVQYACLWCPRRVYWPLKAHLLEYHLEKVIQEVDEHENTFILSSKNQTTKQRPKCSYCGISFSQYSPLRRHQYNKHAKSFLSDEGRLPHSVSEQQLETALAAILTGISGKRVMCPLCGAGSSESNTYHLRAHILSVHLDHVLEKVEGGGSDTRVVVTNNPKQCPQPLPEVVKEVQQPLPLRPTSDDTSKMSRYKCNSCGKLLLSRRILRQHYLRLHSGHQDQYVRRCDHCPQSFCSQFSLRRHHIRSHPVATFHHRLPLGVTDQQFHQAVSIIVGERIMQISSSMG